MAVYDIGFVLEQSLGHVTHTKNLQVNVPLDPQIRAHWGLIAFDPSGIAGKIPIYNSNWSVRAGLRARRYLSVLTRHTPLDAVFFHTQVPAILAQGWLRKLPAIVSLDATPLQYDELGKFYRHETGPAWVEKVKWRLNRDCYAQARKLVVWAEWTKRGLVKDYQVPEHKITVIPPGVTVSEWKRPNPRGDHAGPVKILFVGADLERKGGVNLIDAFKAIRRSGDELHLVTKTPVETEPGVIVHNDMEPNSQRLKSLYHACDIFALPTFGDCLPMVLSEAGAAGMAIVSTEVAAIPEIVRHGETGLTVPPGNTRALADAIRQLVDDSELRQRLGQQATVHVARNYDATDNARRLIDLLKCEVDLTRKKHKQGQSTASSP